MSLRRRLIRLAFENPDVRPAILPLLKQGFGPLPLGAWGGADHFWPETPRGWDEYDYTRDALGDYYKVGYQWIGKPSMTLFVDVDGTDYVNFGGTKPMNYRARGVAQTKSGKVFPKDIPRLLMEIVTWAEGHLNNLKREVARLSDSTWEVSYDGYQIDATFRGPKSSPYSDAHMSVTFDDADDALVDGGRSRARIWFSAGADYQGHYGVKEVERMYSTVADIRKILAEAERLYKQWDQ